MSRDSGIRLDSKELDLISPFYMLIDRNGFVQEYGRSIKKLFPGAIQGRHFHDDWRIKRPKLDLLPNRDLFNLTGKLLVIRNASQADPLLKGQIEPIEGQNRYLFLGSPSLFSSEQLTQYNLQISDFALHDSFTDLIHVLQNNQISNTELKELLDKVNQQKNELIADRSSLRRKERILQAAASAADELLSNEDFEQGLYKSLRVIGEAVSVDRTYLFQNYEDESGGMFTSQKFEWSAQEVEPQINNPDLQDIPIAIFDTFLGPLLSKRPFEAIVEELDDNLDIKNMLIAQEIKSILILPIFHRNKFWGFIGYDDCKSKRVWSQDEVSLLRSFSNNISNAIERSETAKEIYDMALFPLENPNPLIRINLRGEVVLRNPASEFMDHLEVMGKDRKDAVLFRYLGKLLNPQFRQLVFEGKFEERTFQITAKLLVNDEHINIYLTDISKQKEDQIKLQESESKLTSVFNSVKDVIWSVKLPDYKVLLTTPSVEELYEIPLGEWTSDSSYWKRMMHPDDRHIIDKINQELEDVGHYAEEYRIVTPTNNVKWVLNKGQVVYDQSKKPIRIEGIISEITAKKDFEAQLEDALHMAQKASKAKEAFLANMSHEIRTPLNAIIGILRELNKEELTDKQQEYLTNALKASQHLLAIVNNILDISKIEAGELRIESNHFDLLDVLADVEKILTTEASRKFIDFNIRVDKKANHVFTGDQTRIRQILLNLAGNAIKFTDKGGVSIQCSVKEASPKSSTITFTIEDTGIGMEEIFLAEAFTKFHQEDITSSRRHGGTGLGMVITKELVELMNGNISVNSRKGEGTVVKVELVLENGDASQIEVPAQSLATDDLLNKKILLVEDNELNRLVVSNALKPHKVNLSEAENGKVAIQMIESNSYDVILMDIQMPEMNGIEATEHIRSVMNINTPIIALTANAFKSEIDACLKAGMNAYLTKPFEEKDLIRVIFRSLAGEMESTIDLKADLRESLGDSTLYDLSKLEEMSHGDSEFVKQMMRIFISSTPSTIDDLNESLSSFNVDALRKAAHKIKPSIHNLKIDSISQEIRTLEHWPMEEYSTEELEIVVAKIIDVLAAVVREFESQLAS